MRYGSVCSGIEAATMAWHPLGWAPAFFSEIEAFPSAVLAHHYGSNMPGEPIATNGVPNLGDMTKFEEWPDYAIDLLVGGTPCQDYSVAGLRAGMDGIRGSLTLTYAAIARRYRPRWVAWENVPGVFSSNGGRDFASFLGLLSGQRIEVPRDGWGNAGVVPGYNRAYGLAWRVLDAQYVRVDGFGRAVPQRRRRVFVVGYLGDWRLAAAVLLEREGLRGNPAPSRQAGEKPAPTISSRPTGGGGLGTDFDLDGGLIVDDAARCDTAGYAQRLDWETENFIAHEVAGTMKACKDSGGWSNSADHAAAGYMVAHTLKSEGFDASEDGTGRGTPIIPVAPFTLAIRGRGDSHQLEYRQDGTANAVLTPNGGRAGIGVGAIAWSIMPQNSGKDYKARAVEVAQPIMAGGPVGGNQGGDYIQNAWAVRRLTPTECERLQGFPDNFTNVPWGKKDTSPDGPRYKALGNSMAVNVMRWIGRRIEMVEKITKGEAA